MTNNSAQRRSKSYRLPVEDTELLLRDEVRAMRFALEYAKAELSLRDWGVRSTIIVFGSAGPLARTSRNSAALGKGHTGV
jgi:hypothetical protein